jgi:hypothetical protein
MERCGRCVDQLHTTLIRCRGSQKWEKADVSLLLEVALERKDSFQTTKDKVGWYCSLAKEVRLRIRNRNALLPEHERVDMNKLHQPSQKRCHDKITDMTKTCQVLPRYPDVRVLMEAFFSLAHTHRMWPKRTRARVPLHRSSSRSTTTTCRTCSASRLSSRSSRRTLPIQAPPEPGPARQSKKLHQPRARWVRPLASSARNSALVAAACPFGLCRRQKRRKSDELDDSDDSNKENKSGDDSRRKRQRTRVTQLDVLRQLDAQKEAIAESDKALFAKIDAMQAQEKERLEFEKARASKQDEFNTRFLNVLSELAKPR